MNGEIIVALITSGLALVGVIITVIAGNKRTERQIDEQNELTRYRIEQLEKKQDKHNEVIERTYKLEQHNEVQDQKIEYIGEEVSDLKNDLRRFLKK